MNNRTIWLIIFIVFIIEGTLIHWLLPSAWYNGLRLAPHLTLVLVLYVAIMRNRHLGLSFGLIFGLMHDIVYASPMLGSHSFSMGLVAYSAGAIAKRMKMTMTSSFFVITISLILYDFANYSLFRMFRVIVLPLGQTFADFIMPTVLFNLLFAVVIYVPARKWIERAQDYSEDEAHHV